MLTFLLAFLIVVKNVSAAACSADQYLGDSATACDACTAGWGVSQILDASNADACGSKELCVKKTCPIDEYANPTQQCVSCEATKAMPVASSIFVGGANTVCTHCRENYYKATDGSCAGCEAGKSRAAGSAGGATCVWGSCPGGMFPAVTTRKIGCMNCQSQAYPTGTASTIVSGSAMPSLAAAYMNNYMNPYTAEGADKAFVGPTGTAQDIQLPNHYFTQVVQGAQQHSNANQWDAIVGKGTQYAAQFDASPFQASSVAGLNIAPSADAGFFHWFKILKTKCRSCRYNYYWQETAGASANVNHNTCVACQNSQTHWANDSGKPNSAGTGRFALGVSYLAANADPASPGPLTADTPHGGWHSANMLGGIETNMCNACPPNHSIGNTNQCTACVHGKSHAMTPHPSPAAATECATETCPANWHFKTLGSGNTRNCARCESGKSAAATAAAAANQAATPCADMICAADQHVVNQIIHHEANNVSFEAVLSPGVWTFRTCESCPAGYGNEAGDNAQTHKKVGATQPCYVEADRQFRKVGVTYALNAPLPQAVDIPNHWVSNWESSSLWTTHRAWYTHCDTCKANYHVQADTYDCVACDSGKSRAGGSRWVNGGNACSIVPTTADDDSSGVLIGAVCGGIAGVALLGVAAYCCKKKRS